MSVKLQAEIVNLLQVQVLFILLVPSIRIWRIGKEFTVFKVKEIHLKKNHYTEKLLNVLERNPVY